MLEKEQVKIKGPEKISIKKVPELKISREIAGWLERIERGDTINLKKPVIDDQTGQVLVTSPSAKKPKITILPLEKDEFIQGLNQKISEAIRWLAEWCLRLIKIKPKKVSLKT